MDVHVQNWRPILFRWFDEAHDYVEDAQLLVLSQVSSVHREDAGSEDETLSIVCAGTVHVTTDHDTIERFMNAWEMR